MEFRPRRRQRNPRVAPRRARFVHRPARFLDRTVVEAHLGSPTPLSTAECHMDRIAHIVAQTMKYLIICGLAVGVYTVLPPDMQPNLRWLKSTKPVETVTLEQAIAKQDESKG